LDIASTLALLVGAYGAILSTILALREITKDRRRIRLVLHQFIDDDEGFLRVINTGYRPVTIARAIVRMYDLELERVYFKRVDDGVLPATIEDGQHVAIPLEDLPIRYLRPGKDRTYRAEVWVQDIEGTEYVKFVTIPKRDRSDRFVSWTYRVRGYTPPEQREQPAESKDPDTENRTTKDESPAKELPDDIIT
jgi:hypothetical protein